MDTHYPSQSQSAAAIQAGQEALARGAWEEARACFEAVLKDEETPAPRRWREPSTTIQ